MNKKLEPRYEGKIEMWGKSDIEHTVTDKNGKKEVKTTHHVDNPHFRVK